MSILWYKTFIAVARYGSFAAAAQQIGLTQAAISIQMSSLEGALKRILRTAILQARGVKQYFFRAGRHRTRSAP